MVLKPGGSLNSLSFFSDAAGVADFTLAASTLGGLSPTDVFSATADLHRQANGQNSQKSQHDESPVWKVCKLATS